MKLLERLEEHARSRGRGVAVRVSGGAGSVTTYEGLWSRVAACGEALRERFSEGSPIAVGGLSGADFAAAYLGILWAGQIVHPIPQNSSSAEVRAFLEATKAVALIGDRGTIAQAERATLQMIEVGSLPVRPAGRVERPEMSPDAPGLYLPSSGTTGLPKIAVRSRGALDAVARNVAEATGLTPEDRVLAGVPMSHAYGMENGLLAPVWAGSCIHIVGREGTEPGGTNLDVGELLADLQAGAVTVLPGVPFMIDMLAQLAPGERVETGVRLVYTAGSPLPESVAERFSERFGVGVGQLYGMTEIASVTFGRAGASEDRASVGAPMSGVSILILDVDEPGIDRALAAGVEGHVAIRAGSMLSHYLGGDRSDPAFLDGYFLTGDLGRLGSDGCLTITGRLKLLIDVGGFKVNPLEVERTMAQHPGIAEVVVVPVKVTETVSRLRAVIVPARGGVRVEEVKSFVRERLAGHKVPRVIEVVERLPKSPAGKVLRRQVEES